MAEPGCPPGVSVRAGDRWRAVPRRVAPRLRMGDRRAGQARGSHGGL